MVRTKESPLMDKVLYEPHKSMWSKWKGCAETEVLFENDNLWNCDDWKVWYKNLSKTRYL